MNKSIYLCRGLHISFGVIWFCIPIYARPSQTIWAFYLKSSSNVQTIFIFLRTFTPEYFCNKAPITIPSLKSLSKFVSLLSSKRI